METVIIFVVVLGMLGVAACFFALYRNEWVYRNRMALTNRIHDDCGKYIDDCFASIPPKPCDVEGFYAQRTGEYLEYNEMMSPRVWHIWDFEKLRREPKVSDAEWPSYLTN